MHNTKIDGTCKNTSAKPSDARRGDVDQVHRGDYDGLANANASNKSPGVSSAEVTIAYHEYDDADNPGDA